MNISALAQIHLGYQFRKKIEPAPSGPYRVIQIRDFDESRILVLDHLERIDLKNVQEEQFLQKGDILFLARGHRNFASTITANVDNTVAASYFFVLRIQDQKISSQYLTWFLNSPTAQSFFQTVAKRGSHMPLIPKGLFSELDVPVPPLEVQSKIVRLSELAIKEQSLLTTLVEKSRRLTETICLQALERSS